LERHRIATISALLFLALVVPNINAQIIFDAQDPVTAKITVSVTVGSPSPDDLDDWVVFYFGSDYDFSAESDFDGDGCLDYLEFYAGTDPTDGASKLQIIETTLSGNDVTIKWAPTANGDNISRKYRVFCGGPDALGLLTDPEVTIGNLQASPNVDELAEVNSQGFTTSYIDPGASDKFPLFYKVILSQPVPQVPSTP
jgi:hypothetical protein